MSIYEYKCKACSHTFKDVEQAGEKEIVCPLCTSEEVDRTDRDHADASGKAGRSGKLPLR